jgi:UDP-N-acetyl-D-mannosaminuronate dehydrogenase
VELANEVNEHMPGYVVDRLSLAFNRMGRAVNGSRILLLGLAYKRNTGDSRVAPGTTIAQSLAALGADVRVVDPHIVDESVPYPLVELTAEEISAADATVIITDHDAFDYELVRANAAYVFDARNRLHGPTVERL